MAERVAEDKKPTGSAQRAGGLLGLLTSTKALLVLLPVGLTIWGIWVCPKLNILPNIVINDYTPYLLSAIGQSLAAVLALVFTISLIAAQLSSRYSYRVLADFFDPFTVAYMLLFIIAVILPFWLLAQPSLNGLKGSLVLAAVCLLLLVPYFLDFRKRLAPEHMLLNLKNQASKQLHANPNTEPASVITIDNTVMSAFALKDYDTFGKGVQALADLEYEAEKLHYQTGMGSNTAAGISIRLDGIAMATMEDRRASQQVLEALGNIGRSAINDGLEEIVEGILSTLRRLGFEAIEKSLQEVTYQAVWQLDLIYGRMADKSWRQATADVILDLQNIGVKAAKQGMDLPLDKAVTSLGQIGLDSINKGLDEFAKFVTLSLGAIGVEAGKKGLTSEAKEAGYWLVMLGACAVHKRDMDLRSEVVDNLKGIEKATRVNVISFAFWKARNYASVHPGYSATKEDLDKFAKSFQWPESNGNRE